MFTAQTALGAGATTGHGFTLLDHDVNGWTVALIVAVVAAFLYEMIMALTRMVTLRIPFLVLYLARITTPKPDWAGLFSGWKGELWAILRMPGKHWLVRFGKGMAFAVPLALGAARVTAKAAAPKAAHRADRRAAVRAGHRRARRFSVGTAAVGALIGMNGPWIWERLLDSHSYWIVPVFVVGMILLAPPIYLIATMFRPRSKGSGKSG
ncbi:hypothetical protein GCM10010095_71720 [Streptomyces anthocyanicus]|uniref:Uncharacterized protein n=1 Tax=Streptomyces violaceolatus TaxID=67378 RepID=A0ABN3THL8_9ACTN|nr:MULTISPECIES: hypothetical protein [Streptomyces]MBQ0953820.1 hypothetical protein [Streptomyces sp. RK76]GGL76273.1 hypothetical protein GCM10010095_71720 [Streptomyces anthocyanicus]GHC33153.1 hypothetical protein GCM10010348_70080 [Streptomyces anthocyanicus]